MKSAITQKIERVPRPDFKDVWDYASGKVTFSERIDLTSDVGATVPVLDGSGATTTTTIQTTKTTGVDDEMDDEMDARKRRKGGKRKAPGWTKTTVKTRLKSCRTRRGTRV